MKKRGIHMIRTASILVVIALLGVFAWFNLSVLTAVTPISFGFATLEAPFGLVLLGATGILCLLFAVWAVALQTRVLKDARLHTKELQAQRDLADRAESSRLVELRIDLMRALEER
jgi:uncharacterized integral membrane protein